MNLEEYLLSSLSEECGEIIQAVCKAQRFGLDDEYKGRATPRTQILNEVRDLLGVIDALEDLEVIPEVATFETAAHIQSKRDKIDKYITYAQERGTLII